MPAASLSVLGAVEIDGVRVASSASAALLAYLAVHGPRPVPREQVAFALWPDRSEDRARRALSDAVYRLRGAFADGAPWLVADAGEIQLDGVDVDLWEFRRLSDADDPRLLVDALAVHRGSLADGVDDEWVGLPRRAHDESVIRLCERAVSMLSPDERLAVSERWVEIDPYGVEAHRTMIETLLALDRRDRARRAIDRYRSVLDELGIDDAETDRWVALTTDSPTIETPFVGRVAERARLLRMLDEACDGRGGIAVVLGDAGIGKSRLLAELAAAASWRGVDVAMGVGQEGVPARPTAPFDATLADAFDPVRVEQAREHLESDVLHALSNVIPQVGPPAPSDTAPPRAMVRALEWLSSIRPQLLLVDDAQWGGAELWPTILDVAPRVTGLPVLLVVAARRAEVVDGPARRAIGAIEAGGAQVVQLSGLSVGELDELLRVLGRELDARTMHERTGGNPLVAITVADPLDVDTEPRSDSERVSAAAQRRLAGLDAAAEHVVRQAAVLGRSVEYRVLAAACAATVDDVFRCVVDAEVAGLLTRTGGRLAFEHDLVRAAVLRGRSDDELRLLHTAALAAVAEELPHETQRLLGHAEAASDDVSVVAYSIAVGTDALHQSAYRVAEAHFTRALELVGSVDDPLAVHAALGGRVRARNRLSDRVGQGADVAALVAHAERVGEPLLGEALLLEAEYRFAIGEFDAAVASIERNAGHPIGALADRMVTSSDLGRVASITLRELGRYADAEAIGQATLELVEAAGDEREAALMTDVLGGIAWRRGDPRTAAVLHRRAADRFAAIGARGAEARALNNLGTALWAIGNDHAAESVHRRALDVCCELGDRRGEGDNIDNLGGVAFVRGDFRTAIELYDAALRIRRDTDDPWGVSISLSNIGDALRALGDHERALDVIDESIAVNQAAGVVRNEATTRQSRGMVLADLGRHDEALAELVVAEQMHLELGDRIGLLETRGATIEVLVATGSLGDAAQRCASLAAEVAAEDPPRARQLAHVAMSTAYAALGDVAAARHQVGLAAAAMDEVLAGLEPGDAALRRATVPVHRRTTSLIERHGRVIEIELAPVDAPSGPVDPDHLVTVRWTVERPDDDLIGDVPSRRRAVLLRLLAESTAAGAAPTDEQLAAACGVARRTVLRDVEVLRAHGHRVATRGRQSQPSALGDRPAH